MRQGHTRGTAMRAAVPGRVLIHVKACANGRRILHHEMAHLVKINRAPVLTLWAAVVAQRLGFDWSEALTLGRAVAGLNAYSKGVSLGLFEPSPEAVKEQRKKAQEDAIKVSILHRAVPCRRTDEGLRAITNGKPISPESVQRYLDGKFGADLETTKKAMERLARSMTPKELGGVAYKLYEEFRPRVPAGTREWGAIGDLDLDKISALAA